MGAMKLDAYLNLPDAMSAAELGRRIGLTAADHLRAWRHGYAGRKPSPKFCVAIERETGGQVTRQDLRPDDYWLHWPDLPAPNKVAHRKTRRRGHAAAAAEAHGAGPR